jgi:PHD/YefM family antitoxin component YafN of YafNO toxin-antitoxin module
MDVPAQHGASGREGGKLTMPVRSGQVQQEFGEVIDQSLEGEDVIVERHGAPWVVVIKFQRYQQLLEAERELLRSRLQQASAEASTRAAHLSEAEVDALIERARDEAHEERRSA